MIKNTIRNSVPVTEIGAYMQKWAQKRSGQVTLRVIGKSGGYDIHAAVFTDPAVPDENKQIAMIVAQHSGMEISGMNSVMSLGNYLAAGKGRTEEILRKMKVVLVPCPNPYSFAQQNGDYTFKNEFGVDEYGAAFTYDGAKTDGRFPAAVALQALTDDFQPDILLDAHGTTFNYQMVIPSISYSGWANNRLYNEAMDREIQKAGDAVGIGTYDNDWIETLPQTDKTCTDPAYLSKFRFSFEGRAVLPLYAYHKYHTMAASLEIGWEEEACMRLVRALEIGCEKQPQEYYEGYPTRTVAVSGHNSLRAYGTNAAQRRASRVELWAKKKDISLSYAYPEMPGLAAAVVSLSPAKAEEYAPGSADAPIGCTFMTDVAEHMRGIPGVNADAMRAVFDSAYESFVRVNTEGGDVQIEHGMTVRMALPFRDARIRSVLYNGNPLTEDELDGYTVTACDNWVMADVHIPPEKIADFAVITVSYDCTVPKCGVVEF